MRTLLTKSKQDSRPWLHLLRSPHENFNQEETWRATLASTSFESQGRFQRCNETSLFFGLGQMADWWNAEEFSRINRMGWNLVHILGLLQHGWFFAQSVIVPQISICTPFSFRKWWPRSPLTSHGKEKRFLRKKHRCYKVFEKNKEEKRHSSQRIKEQDKGMN